MITIQGTVVNCTECRRGFPQPNESMAASFAAAHSHWHQSDLKPLTPAPEVRLTRRGKIVLGFLILLLWIICLRLLVYLTPYLR